MAHIVLRNLDVFSCEATNLGSTHILKHDINTNGTQHMKQQLYRESFKECAII